jgi:hypothetical protein
MNEEVKYNEELSLYTNESGLVYTRVSHFLESFVEKADWDQIKKATAKRDGVTVESVNAGWQEALDKGDELHLAVEQRLKGYPVSPDIIQYAPVAEQILDFILSFNYHHYESELGLIYDDLMTTGTADIVGYRSRSAKSIVDIWDVKGNAAKFKFQGTGKYFLDPISHLEYNYYNRTALQTSLYMYFAENGKGHRPGICGALVVNRDKPELGFTRYIMPYMKAEVQAMIDYKFPIKS